MKSLRLLATILPLTASVVIPRASPDCSSFVGAIPLSDYTFLNATYYPANALNVTNTFNEVPFCEVYGSISYGSNDSLTFAVWLPGESHYENRFLAVGNGGMAGTIDYLNMVTQLNAGLGFAVAGGDAGHSAADNNDGGGAPGVYIPYFHDKDQVKAWIHDAISLFTPAARAIAKEYYGQPQSYSYYDGCSTGGAQGYALAQYHPNLFDGIFAGSPGNWYSHLALSFLWNAQHTNTSATNLTQEILNFTTNAVLQACDTIDGVADGLIENPLECVFDIDQLACTTEETQSENDITCLTKDQIAAAKSIYSGPVRSDNCSKQLYPGFSFGSEIEWLLQEGTLADAFSIPILQNLVYDKLDYNSDNFNWASDVGDLNQRAGRLIDEISPDLSAFRSSGGKLITTQGWADPYNAATWPIEHLKQIQDFFGGDVSDFINVFMVPGGGHCAGAEYYPQAPGTWHMVKPLVDWVEKGIEPSQLLASDPADGSDRMRKLCPWPQTAKYISGDVDDWESYTCQ